MSTPRGREELNSIRGWIDSLSRDELVHAMEFKFLTDEDSSEKSHEFDLLAQMVKLQSPVRTPIHPRALGFKPATTIGATDGRNEDERVTKSRFRGPRLFQFVELGNSGFSLRNGGSLPGSGRQRHGRRRQPQPRPNRVKKYDVIARKFVTSWGDLLSIGCTKDQQEADDYILKATGIKQGSAFDATYCSFDSPPDDATSLLRILRIATRGKFLSVPFLQTQTSTGARRNGSATLFCAPWLDPTQRWFSLQLYLVSRYEVALWTAFRQRKNRIPLSFQAIDALEKLSHEKLLFTITKSLVVTLVGDVFAQDAASSEVRDCTLWHLLDCQWRHLIHYQAKPAQNAHAVYVTPILELGSKTEKLRLLLQKHLQEALAQEVAKDLVCSLDDEPKSAKSIESPSRKRRSRKKKRNKQRIVLPVLHEEKKTTGNDVGESAEDSSGDELEVTVNKARLPASAPPSRDRNKITITVLSLLDEVVESVFDQVGVNSYKSDQASSLDDVTGSPENRGNATIMSDKGHQGGESACGENKNEVEREVIAPDPATEASKSSARSGSPEHNDSHFRSLAQEDPQMSLSPDPHSVPFEPGVFDIHSSTDLSLNFHHSFDSWGRMNGYQSREKSLFTDFFLTSEDAGQNQEDCLLASSTAASIASSSGVDEYYSDEAQDNSSGVETANELPESEREFIHEETPVQEQTSQSPSTMKNDLGGEAEHALFPLVVDGVVASRENAVAPDLPRTPVGSIKPADDSITPKAVSPCGSPMRSPSPTAPKTPPPQLSPILVSLADLKKLRRRTTSGEFGKGVSGKRKESSSSALTVGSLPNSPVPPTSRKGLTPSWSREDLRISSFTEDDQQLRRIDATRQGDTLLSYRNAAARSLIKPVSSVPEKKTRDLEDPASSKLDGPEVPYSNASKQPSKPPYAQSDTAFEAQDEGRHLMDHQKSHNDETDNITTTKDGSTTISALSPHGSDDISSLREERNSFRDMCLTLGAEVAMLKNLLAAEGSRYCPSMEYSQGFPQAVQGPSHGPELIPPFFQGIPIGMSSSRTVGAMSDAGVHRCDHESINVSEDGTDVVGPHENPGGVRAVHVRRMDSATFQGSDASIDHTLSAPSDFRTLNREAFGSVPTHGLHSRLTKDIMNFLSATRVQLRKQANRRRLATERLSRLITALWPRAQVKLYGSHVSGNCLPSSDLDFVICLPAVHKNAPAVTPGVLEGRNAINETSQKLLARKLKSESWIDPNSIKLVERTAVPIIKLSTKDTRARVLQLDISFDGPEHRGLDSIDLVQSIMQELPMIRPLILVLKQFLLDRGLLTAFTGGLSSYCLFLMITRYLQEQPSSWGDCGSLLMGFLDFYGNSFDPRATGISVSRRQYFSRLNYAPVPSYPADQQMWNVGHTPRAISSPGPPLSGSPEFLRRHSFNEKAGNANNAGTPTPSPTTHGMRPPRFQPPSSSSPRRYVPHVPQHQAQAQYVQYDHVAKPYTFDPLFVEDPLSAGNNVGRNAFRINQVQRAFSDAHRALVASLEWDIYSSSDLHDAMDNYPLLKCLLQSEDVFYELEDPR